MLADLIPTESVDYLGPSPQDLENTRAFFAKMASQPPNPGTPMLLVLINISGDSFADLSLCDPIFGIPYRIISLKVLKVFKAKTKPTLCDVSFNNNHAPMRFIFKTGDDLRRDMYVESTFFVMNQV